MDAESFTQLLEAGARPSVAAQMDARLLVRFFKKPTLNETRTKKEGSPKYDDTEFVEIMVPGDKDNIVVERVTDQHRKRFPKEYDRDIVRPGQTPQVGTPLEVWPQVSRSQVEEFKHFHVHTIEQLAEMSDANAQKFMGGMDLKRKAADFVAMSNGNSHLSAMRDQLAKKDSEIEAMQKLLKEQGDKIDQLLRAKNQR